MFFKIRMCQGYLIESDFVFDRPVHELVDVVVLVAPCVCYQAGGVPGLGPDGGV